MKKDVYKIAVDCTVSLQAMIDACRFERVAQLITDDVFVIAGKGKYEVDICFLDLGYCSTDEMFIKVDKLGFRPARAEEVLALVAAHRELVDVRMIHALGTVGLIGGKPHCLIATAAFDGNDLRSLGGNKLPRTKRTLMMGVLSGDWGGKIAAVRKAHFEPS